MTTRSPDPSPGTNRHDLQLMWQDHSRQLVYSMQHRLRSEDHLQGVVDVLLSAKCYASE